MPLGVYNLLPFLKGWEYKAHVAERIAVIRGADPIDCVSVDERGWIDAIQLLTNDAYGTAIIEYQGAELETQTFRVWPEAYRDIGAFAQDPAGWIQMYRRPNPYSTAGLYLVGALSAGFQGSMFGYVPSFKVKLHLSSDSTQDSAYILAIGSVTAITDPKAFLISLRKILGIKGKIDPDIFTVGPAPLKEEV